MPTHLAHVSRRNRLAYRIGITICAVLATVAPAPAHAQGFFDGFEGSTINSFWTPFQQLGTVQLSTAQSQSGQQSLNLSSETGGQRNVWLSHVFPGPTKGTLSVWFYDSSPGTPTLYSGLYAFNSVDGGEFGVNVADWDATRYVWHGGGTPETSTTVPRTLGWHQFTIQVNETDFTSSIDGVVVGSGSGDFAFDSVSLLLSGPGSASASFYFDDFSFTPLPSSDYAIRLLYDPTRAHRQNSTIPIKVQLCDGSGGNVSDASIVVTAVHVVRTSDDTAGVLDDSGDANPDLNFRYSSDLEGYIFNLSTKGLSGGTYAIRVAVDGEPTPLLIPFRIR